jgi:predicted ATPase
MILSYLIYLLLVVGSKTIQILGRQLTFNRCCGRVLDVPFDDLCVRALGATDYLAIARVFQTVILRGIPIFNRPSSELRRFITLIDSLYDHKVIYLSLF